MEYLSIQRNGDAETPEFSVFLLMTKPKIPETPGHSPYFDGPAHVDRATGST